MALKRDPRAEEDGETSSVERVATTEITADKPKRASIREAEKTEEPEAKDESGVVELAAKPREREAKKSEPPPRITSEDPRILAIEPFLETNDWKGATKELGSLEDAGKLPPNLGLLCAIAHNEATPDGSIEARNLAVRCTAALMGMPAESEIARIVARRLLRKAPVRLAEREAPPAKTSAMIVVVVLALGGALGWFLSTPYASHLLAILKTKI